MSKRRRKQHSTRQSNARTWHNYQKTLNDNAGIQGVPCTQLQSSFRMRLHRSHLLCCLPPLLAFRPVCGFVSAVHPLELSTESIELLSVATLITGSRINHYNLLGRSDTDIVGKRILVHTCRSDSRCCRRDRGSCDIRTIVFDHKDCSQWLADKR